MTREKDELVRSSALAILAQCCELLRFALHPFLEDLIECLAMLAKDRSDIVCGCTHDAVFHRHRYVAVQCTW